MESPEHVGPLVIVINAGSGKQEHEGVRATIARTLDACGRAHEFMVVGDPAGIAKVAARAVARARDLGGVVVAVGGDGTLNAVAQAVLGSGLAFGVVPQGTFNYFGRAHGIPQDAESALKALLGARPRAVQVGRVNGQVFLVNASLGLYPKLLENREEHTRQFGRGRWVAIWSGLITLMREPRALRLEIESEQGPRRVRTPTLFVGNNALQLDQIGVAEADAVARNGGWLAAIMLRPISTLAMLGLALRGALGRLGEAEQVETFRFRKLTVNPVGRRRIKVATDGEIRVLRAPLRFEVSPQPLMLLLPSEADRVEVA